MYSLFLSLFQFLFSVFLAFFGNYSVCSFISSFYFPLQLLRSCFFFFLSMYNLHTLIAQVFCVHFDHFKMHLYNPQSRNIQNSFIPPKDPFCYFSVNSHSHPIKQLCIEFLSQIAQISLICYRTYKMNHMLFSFVSTLFSHSIIVLKSIHPVYTSYFKLMSSLPLFECTINLYFCFCFIKIHSWPSEIFPV